MANLAEDKNIWTFRHKPSRRLAPFAQPLRGARRGDLGLATLKSAYARELSSILLKARRLAAHYKTPDFSQAEFDSSVIAPARDAVKSFFTKAYMRGLSNLVAGVNRGDLEAGEKKWIDSASRQEMVYLNKLITSVLHNPDIPVDQRLKNYTFALESLYDSGMVTAGPDDSIIRWINDPLAENCPDCLLLAQYEYTRDTLPTTPRAGLTRCMYNCRCHLEVVPVDTNVVTATADSVPDRSFFLGHFRRRR